MARIAGFKGIVEVYGWGVGPRTEAREQRNYTRNHNAEHPTLGTYYANKIRVWTRSRCQLADEGRLDPLFVYGHELGHFMADSRGKDVQGERGERIADAYASWLIRKAVGVRKAKVHYSRC